MILFFQWNSFMNKGIENALHSMHKEYEIYYYIFQDWESDAKFEVDFRKILKHRIYECVLSVNFSPLISNACEERGVPYISWIYDSPIHIKNTASLCNSVNHAYFFDKDQANAYVKIGIPAKYMPLAVDPDVFDIPISFEDRVAFSSQISFVGQLYQTYYDYYTSPLSPYYKGYLEGIIQAQSKIYGGYILPELLTTDFLEKINQQYLSSTNGSLSISKPELEYMLAGEITGRERFLCLSLLANHFNVSLYTSQKNNNLKNIIFKGYADYYSQMPKIFHCSDINLNVSLKAIRTGIPLRILDVLGCHGFLITNFQSELTDYFKINEEIIVYENAEDLYEKTVFYTSHDSERKRIAQNGYHRVLKSFAFQDKLESMLKQL